MTSITTRLELLDGLPKREISGILIHAFRFATREERSSLALGMVERGLGLETVIARLDELDPGIAARLADPTLDLDAALRGLLSRPHPVAAANAMRVIQARGAAAHASRIGALLEGPPDHRWSEARSRAAGTLLHLAIDLDRRPDAVATQPLRSAVRRASRLGLGARYAEVLLAGLLLEDRDDRTLEAWLATLDDASTLVLRGLFARSDLPEIRRRLVRWLGRAPVRPHVARRWHLATDGGPEAMADLLEDGHLLRTPSRRRGLRRGDRPVRCVPDALSMPLLPERIQACLPDLIQSVGLSARGRLERLAGCSTLPAPVARLRALVALRHLDRSDAAEAAAGALSDEDAAVSRAAAQVMLSWPAAHAASRVAALAPPDLAVRGALREASIDAEALRRHADRLSPTALAASARRLADEQPAALDRALACMLGQDPPPTRRAALSLVRRLRRGEEHLNALLRLASGDDPIAASAAVSVLASLRRADLVDPLLDLAAHADSRVRANAIEGLATVRDRRVDDAARAAISDPVNRPRANAVAAILARTPADGVASLRAMLGDPDPAHRISGVWVARRHGIRDVCDLLDQLAGEHVHPEVARRAATANTVLRHHPDTTLRRTESAA